MKKENPVGVSFGDGTGSSSHASRRLPAPMYDSVDGSQIPCARAELLRGMAAKYTRQIPRPRRSLARPRQIPSTKIPSENLPKEQHAAAG